jgi:hypothetical protein
MYTYKVQVSSKGMRHTMHVYEIHASKICTCRGRASHRRVFWSLKQGLKRRAACVEGGVGKSAENSPSQDTLSLPPFHEQHRFTLIYSSYTEGQDNATVSR